jgi:uncharacterized protein with GYD domain
VVFITTDRSEENNEKLQKHQSYPTGHHQLQEGPERVERFRQAVEASGGKLAGWYLTMGRYDVVSVLQVTDAKIIAKLMLATEAMSTIRTETMRAFTLDEAKEIIAGMT